jgi:HEAT repeat protein
MLNWYSCLDFIVSNSLDSPQVVDLLVAALSSQEDEFVLVDISRELGKISPNNQTLLDTLHDLISESHSKDIRIEASEVLYDIRANDPHLKSVLNDLTISTESEWPKICPSWLRAARLLVKIDVENENAISILVNEIFSDDLTSGEISVGFILEVLNLNQLFLIVEKISQRFRNEKKPLFRNQHDANQSSTSILLSQIQENQARGIEESHEFVLKAASDSLHFYHMGTVLFHCVQNMSYSDFYRAWHDFSPSTDIESSTE